MVILRKFGQSEMLESQSKAQKTWIIT